MQRKRILLGYLVIGLVAFGPLLVALGAGAVASLLGCRLNEGSVNPCQTGSGDIGSTLYALGMLGWLSIATIPLAGLLFLIFTGYVILKRIRSR